MKRRRLCVSFDEPTWLALGRWCDGQQRERRTEAVRMAVRAFLRSTQVQVTAGLDDWKADAGSTQRFNGASLSYLRSPHSAEGGHEIRVGGRALWVLPDGRTSGQRRSRLITQALAVAQHTADPQVDPIVLVAGSLWVAEAGVLIYRSTE
jgi:hypothetical protein